ncbi:uncharacterized protein LOC101736278 isoform X2 [Bombyx mori]|nr:uncharacterized protein LOC101736278 isoform X2 [Bombyx mori]XP_021204967.1 uncharacterized protein LOC101736278 isoform X2 [Bombyx mori]XP_021204968.1 uncharacterized protein LOC101736278 isoform X2 [Bombyx mori]XP_037873109.1 uncharacterized protein LOC101736278 isoform X2 [Bombyx mori]
MFSLPPARAIFYGVTAVAALFKTIFGCMLIHGTFRVLLLWILLLAIAVQTQKVVESNEDHDLYFQNVTTLYPVINKTELYNKSNESALQLNRWNKLGAVSWKIDASYAESNLNDKDNTTNWTNSSDIKNNKINLKEIKYHIAQNNNADSKEETFPKHYIGNPPNLINAKDNMMKEVIKEGSDEKFFKDDKGSVKEFRPSQPLGTFFDDDEFVTAPYNGYSSIGNKPDSVFVSSPPDSTGHIIKHSESPEYQAFPYKFESPIYETTKDTWHPDNFEAKPTAVIPFKVPAGGLYKLTDPFQDPVISNEDFGLTVNGDHKEEYHVIKRANPWKNLLRLVKAFIPVGLIIAALTPNVITIENSGPSNQNPNIYRRSEAGIPDVAPISERCRRRLLCELRSDINYVSDSNNFRGIGKQCYKIHCEDAHTVQKMLNWLFSYYRPANGQSRTNYT